METLIPWKYVLSAVVFSTTGIVIMITGIMIFDKLTPGRLWQEIVVEKNLPLALTCSASIIALGLIIASAIHG